MKYKIIGFTKYPNGWDKDCIAITENGKKILVDPFVGCAFEYDNRDVLLNAWYETKEPHWWYGKDHRELDNNDEILCPNENDFKVIYEPKVNMITKIKTLWNSQSTQTSSK